MAKLNQVPIDRSNTPVYQPLINPEETAAPEEAALVRDWGQAR
jgi:hypothetical protein